MLDFLSSFSEFWLYDLIDLRFCVLLFLLPCLLDKCFDLRLCPLMSDFFPLLETDNVKSSEFSYWVCWVYLSSFFFFFGLSKIYDWLLVLGRFLSKSYST